MHIMGRLLFVAAMLSVSSVAHAQYTFEYNGQTIRIDPDRGTVSIPGVYDNTGQKQKRSRRDQDATRKQASPSATDTPATAQTPANAAPAAAAPTSQPPASTTPATSTATVTSAPNAPNPASPAPAAIPQSPSSAAVPAPATTSAAPAVPPPAAIAAPAAVAAAPASAQVPATDVNSPIGIWLTEEKEGKIRIEQCGANLCGYALDAKSNQNREQILIDMRSGQDKNQDKNQDKKWSGRIFDPNTGSTYDSTIAMNRPDSLRVQGCAFGGMFCGGQTWTRAN
jgi:uncharacterized protein (DUF2147 family)